MSDDENTAMITGKDLIEMGFQPAAWFGDALKEINAKRMSISQAARHCKKIADDLAAAEAARLARQMPLRDEPGPYHINLTAYTAEEQENLDKVRETFSELMRTPVIVRGVVMPDACPAGPVGTIPVGGVIAARNAVLPGAHSADICCSMSATMLEAADLKELLDALHEVSHFGPGGRSRADEIELPKYLRDKFDENPLLKKGRIPAAARSHFASSGDGNHFIFVGKSKTYGSPTIVTHFGSRGPGAMLYKLGIEIAERYRLDISPETLPGNAWIPMDTEEGQIYWDALQIMREWTKQSHAALHDAAIKKLDLNITRQLWNEHNFVFEEDDGHPDGKLYWHAKGATPIHNPLLPDTDGTQIIPLNMAQPILFVQGTRTEANLGFGPHGAGRNKSRTEHEKSHGDRPKSEIFEEETKGLDIRFWSNRMDVSELPSAYKNAESVRKDMDHFKLCRVVDEIMPYGSIMAGDCDFDAPWRKKARAKAQHKQNSKQ